MFSKFYFIYIINLSKFTKILLLEKAENNCFSQLLTKPDTLDDSK